MLPIFQFAVCIFCAAIFSTYPFCFGLVIFYLYPHCFAALYIKHNLLHCCQSVAVFLNVFDNPNTTNTSFSVSNIVLSCSFRFTCRQRCVKRQVMPICCLLNRCQYVLRCLCVAVVNNFQVAFVCFFAYIFIPTLFCAFC